MIAPNKSMTAAYTIGGRAYKPRKDVRERFMALVEQDPNGGCWLWAGCNDGGAGYGRFTAKKAIGETQAHRAAYVLFCEPLPRNLEVDHKCRVTACVNPAHLEAVTREENMRRAPKTGLKFGGPANGERQRRKTHCPQGHAYAETASFTSAGWRRCKRCNADRQSVINRRKRQES